MLALPIDDLLPNLVATLGAGGALVLQAPPGAGKTTRVPWALLDAHPIGSVIVLEPRRLAARLSATRVASERGARVGGLVGYDVRFDRQIGPDTRLQFVTEGVFARRILDDPELRSVTTVVLDEFHERHLQTDLALGLVRDLRTRRSDLRVVVMSATLDADPVARFLDAPLLTSEGRRFDVAIEYLAQIDDRPLHSQVASAVRRLVDEGLDGDVLVFLPGAAEIRRATEACAQVASAADLLVLPLHGDLPPAAQDRAIATADRRKVILSTNVAETSVTIEGVVAVIDSGLARIAGHDPWSGRPTLEIAKISRASATQRAGRAGRVRAGRALRLYTRGDHDTRREHDLPEVVRADLSEAVMMLRTSGIDPHAFGWLTPPPKGALEGAELLLQRLGALDPKLEPTSIGRRMMRFPLPPRAARVLVEAESRGVSDDGATVAALLGEGRDVYARSFDDRGRVASGALDAESDLVVRVADLDEAFPNGKLDADRARRIGLDVGNAASIDRVRRQLLRQCDRSRGADDPDAALRISILAGFPDRVARRRSTQDGRLGASRELVLSGGGSATLAESSAVRTATFLVAVEAGDRRVAGGRAASHVSLASAIEPEWLIDLFPDVVREVVDATFREDVERVEAVERMTYDRIVLDERPAGRSGEAAIAQLLAERARAKGIRAFVEGDEIDRLLLRIHFLQKHAPDLAQKAKLEAIDEATLVEVLDAACVGKRSFAELRAAGLLDEVRARIGHAALAKLDQLAPERIVIGHDRRTQIEYAHDRPPSIASRLQDFFGSRETPRIAEGRVALVLHLLAPNGRDVQVTTDLAGFWVRHYPQIRNELARKYPRHSWPIDPENAAPPAPRPRR